MQTSTTATIEACEEDVVAPIVSTFSPQQATAYDSQSIEPTPRGKEVIKEKAEDEANENEYGYDDADFESSPSSPVKSPVPITASTVDVEKDDNVGLTIEDLPFTAEGVDSNNEMAPLPELDVPSLTANTGTAETANTEACVVQEQAEEEAALSNPLLVDAPNCDDKSISSVNHKDGEEENISPLYEPEGEAPAITVAPVDPVIEAPIVAKDEIGRAHV